MLPIDATTPPAAAPNGSVEDGLGRNDFLLMLIAQLENQDPLDPQEATEFSAQLAQFSSLEQLIGMRQSIDGFVESQNRTGGDSAGLTAVGMIGHEVTAESDLLELAGSGDGRSLRFDLAADADRVSVEVLDANGASQVVFEAGPLGAGVHSLAFDGRDQYGSPLPPGIYRLAVTAHAGDEAVDASSLVTGRVDAASLMGSPQVHVGSLAFALSDIREVRAIQEVTP